MSPSLYPAELLRLRAISVVRERNLHAVSIKARVPRFPATRSLRIRLEPDGYRLPEMEMRVLGRTGVRVSPLCLGAMMFGAFGNPDHDESIQTIHRALDAGINFIDTADIYSLGESEEIVGKALAGGKRDRVVLATKVHGTMSDDLNERGNSRRWIMREVEASLRRLNTDWIDLYQIHRPDPSCAIEETLSALTDLVRAGKIRYFGSSTFPAHEIVEAQWASDKRGLERFVCEQPPYSLLVRGAEIGVLPVCESYGIGVIPWSPLAGGWLSGRYRKNVELPSSHRALPGASSVDLSLPANQAKLDAADKLAALAEEAGLSLVQMALAFVLEHPAVTSAIIGPRTLEQLETQLGAEEIRLDRELLDRIDEIVPPGTTINPADCGWDPPALPPTESRRRSLA